MLVAGAADLVLLFVGLELISIPTYMLLYMGRRDAACQEATAKYFYLSLLASAMLLYGLSFLYGAAGSRNCPPSGALSNAALAEPAFASCQGGRGVDPGRAVFPRHGRALPLLRPRRVSGHHARQRGPVVGGAQGGRVVGPDAAVIGRPCHGDVAAGARCWSFSVATMTVGNVLALWQDNLRRLLAYSSIANAGYMLIGLAVGLANGRQRRHVGRPGGHALLPVRLRRRHAGAVRRFDLLGPPRQMLEAVDELAGLGRVRPLVAAADGLVPVQPGRPAAAWRAVGQADVVRQRLGRRGRPRAGRGLPRWRSSAS